MSISSLSSLATTAFDTARSTLKAMADAAAAPPADAAKAALGTGRTAADLSAMTQDTVEVSAPKAAKQTTAPVAAEQQTPVRPRSRLGNSLDSYA
jgi:hypothetical protein